MISQKGIDFIKKEEGLSLKAIPIIRGFQSATVVRSTKTETP